MASPILDTTLGSGDLRRSGRFYDAVFATIGWRREPEKDKGWLQYGPDGDGGAGFCVTTPFDGRPPSAGNGTMITLKAASAAEVHAFHEAALAHGGTSEGGPGTRPRYEPTFYVCYVRDPDGNKLACVFDRHGLGP